MSGAVPPPPDTFYSVMLKQALYFTFAVSKLLQKTMRLLLGKALSLV